jgi:tetratricopeptide (TPR) repeat protein
MKFISISFFVFFSVAVHAQVLIDSVDIKNYYRKYMKSGYEAYQKNDYVDALYFFETANKTMPYDTLPLLNILHIYLDQKNYDKILSTTDRLLAINYHSPSIYTLTSSIKTNKGNTQEALKIITKGLSKNPGNKTLLLMKSNLELDENKEADAIATINELIVATNETHYYANIGMLYENLGQPDSAIAAYETCINYNADNLEALNGLAFLYFVKGEAIKDKAYALPVENIETFKSLLAQAKEVFSKASIYIKRALQLNNNDIELRELAFKIERRLID